MIDIILPQKLFDIWSNNALKGWQYCEENYGIQANTFTYRNHNLKIIDEKKFIDFLLRYS